MGVGVGGVCAVLLSRMWFLAGPANGANRNLQYAALMEQQIVSMSVNFRAAFQVGCLVWCGVVWCVVLCCVVLTELNVWDGQYCFGAL